MQVTYTTPSGYSWQLCDDILKQEHVMIGGTTGSGKSTLLHSIIFSALAHSPVTVQFVLIDLKGTELMDYEHLPHTLAYADEPTQAIRALEYADRLMRSRLETMKKARQKTYTGADIYIIIDEMAVLMQTTKAKTLPILADIMRLGRAAKVHVISATQNPSRSKGGGAPTEIQQNVTSSVCLRVRSAIEARQLLGVNGPEKFRREDYLAMYWNTDGITTVKLPLTPEADLKERIRYWMSAKPTRATGKETKCSQNGFFSRFSHVFSR